MSSFESLYTYIFACNNTYIFACNNFNKAPSAQRNKLSSLLAKISYQYLDNNEWSIIRYYYPTAKEGLCFFAILMLVHAIKVFFLLRSLFFLQIFINKNPHVFQQDARNLVYFPNFCLSFSLRLRPQRVRYPLILRFHDSKQRMLSRDSHDNKLRAYFWGSSSYEQNRGENVTPPYLAASLESSFKVRRFMFLYQILLKLF